MPHHCVLKDKLTSHTRPVFDASVKTTLANNLQGKSLNNYLHIGEKLQTDIQSILISFQSGEFAIVADIRQLFLQIEIAEQHKPFLRFLFRENSNQPIQEGEFNRVVFGLSPSPWLAQASLRLASAKEPEIHQLVSRNFYIDDWLQTCNDLNEGTRLINLMIQTMKKHKFQMHKFASNSKKLLSTIGTISDTDDIVAFFPNDVVGTLGLRWKTSSDTFNYVIKNTSEPKTYTERIILSALASIYDPIGWLSPILVPFRWLYQEICATHCDWDSEIEEDTKQKWLKLKEELHCLENIEIPRWIRARKNDKVTIIGTADSSEKCAAALVYARVLTCDGTIHIKLLARRTKIAPLGKQITVPKLELLAAEMLVNLTIKTTTALNIELKKENVFLFSDSQVVLCWLKEAEIYKRKVYIANRVIRMNHLIPAKFWHYIKSTDNPADVPSRGLTGNQLKTCEMYWQGPSWWYVTKSLSFPPKKHLLRNSN